MNDLEMYKAWVAERVAAGDAKSIWEDIARRVALLDIRLCEWSRAAWTELDRLAEGR